MYLTLCPGGKWENVYATCPAYAGVRGDEASPTYEESYVPTDLDVAMCMVELANDRTINVMQLHLSQATGFY